MGIKKRSKVNAQFNMSSLTDIIFLLLIFFMLTSSMVVPNALNLKLPGKAQKPPVLKRTPTEILIKRDGTYYINNKKVSTRALEKAVAALKKQGKEVSISIIPHPKVANEKVVAVMDIAYRYGVDAGLLNPRN